MTAQRYTPVAIVLHWAIAFAIVFNLVLGFWMHITAEQGGVNQAVFEAFQLHKSIGLSVLALSLVRLGWRFTHKPPPLPAAMPAWEKTASQAVHWLFYFLMIALPLSGWLYVSTGWSHEQERPLVVPTLYFGLFQVPHLFGLSEGSAESRAGLADATFTAHYVFAYAAIALAIGHVGAALKHHFINRDEVLAHMVPGIKAPNESERPVRSPARAAALGVGLALVAIAAASLLYAGLTLGSGAPAAAPPDAPAETAPVAPEAATPNEPAPAAQPDAQPNATAQAPAAWRVNQSASAIRFSGTHSGAAFQGAFSRWRAQIQFDPSNLDASSAVVTIETGSAADGVPVHDSSLPEAEWFDVAHHPTAVFRTTRIRARSDGSYEARGALTIKGRPIDVDLPFTLRIDGERAMMDGRINIDRRAANLGMDSDPDAEWVSREIGVTVHVEATRVS